MACRGHLFRFILLFHYLFRDWAAFLQAAHFFMDTSLETIKFCGKIYSIASLAIGSFYTSFLMGGPYPPGRLNLFENLTSLFFVIKYI